MKSELGWRMQKVSSNLENVWRSSKLSLSLKKRLGKALVWSVALYGCEI